MVEPLIPRITKSTAVAAIIARFATTEELLKRFEVAKSQANLWDGERDGMREAVKTLDGARYGNTILSWSTTAPVMYPNSSGKHQLENCLQTSIPAIPVADKGAERVDGSLNEGDSIIVFQFAGDASEFLDKILHHMQESKGNAIRYITESCLGTGELVKNNSLYEKKGADKSTITVLPEV